MMSIVQEGVERRISSAIGDRVPGVAVAVADAAGIRYAAGVGLADIASQVPAAPSMVCPWFSMTKIVTVTAAMQMVEKRQLGLDESVVQHYARFGRMRPASRAERVTVRHLMSHSSGLANPIPVSWVHPADEPGPDPDRFLDGLLSKHSQLRFDPGSRSSYSNIGTLVLGAVISRASGRPFVDHIDDAILRPLGMHDTSFRYTPEMSSRAATGYHSRRSPMRLLLPRWVVGENVGRFVSLNPFLLDGAAYGGLVGSVESAVRFVRMHLRGGELDGVRLLSRDSTVLMREVTVRGRRFDLGLGWFRPANARDASPAFVEHLGGGAGFFNDMRIYPELGTGVVVMGNSTKYDLAAVHRAVLEIARG